jgi:hypothetical protein
LRIFRGHRRLALVHFRRARNGRERMMLLRKDGSGVIAILAVPRVAFRRDGAPKPQTGLVLLRPLTGFYSAVDPSGLDGALQPRMERGIDKSIEGEQSPRDTPAKMRRSRIIEKNCSSNTYRHMGCRKLRQIKASSIAMETRSCAVRGSA